MKVVLVRHGKTEYNKLGIVGGHSDAQLSEEGHESNRQIAEALKDLELDMIYSSDLSRAVETAKEIAKYHPDTPLALCNLLRERNYGIYEGKKKPEHWKGRGKSKWDAPGGEEWQDVEKRVMEFVDNLKQLHMGNTVLIVGHNGSLGILIPLLLGKADYTEHLDGGLENSSPIFIELAETSARLIER